MIVHSSAIMAMLLKETEREAFAILLVAAGGARLSAGSWIELSAVLTRGRRAALFPMLDTIMEDFAIRIVQTTERQARIAHDAYRIFGIGTGHPARLNFGDCFAYALARETGEPLLFKGDDFAQTDVVAAR